MFTSISIQQIVDRFLNFMRIEAFRCRVFKLAQVR
jgi:hypothetical protein